eukprot:Hpha_TRINITY_DN27380_c0_g1::TRINITY_DN27380_c0_g1_i1::g.551::m.551
MALQLFISLPTGEKMPVELPVMATVGDLRLRVAEAAGLPAQRVRMTSGEASLTDDDTTLADAGLCPESLVDISEGRPAVVLDCGTFWTRAGFAGEKVPAVVFPSFVGRPRVMPRLPGDREYYVGEEANRKRGVLILKYPVDSRIISDWNDVILLWRHAFEELGVKPEEQPILMTEPAFNPTCNRTRTVQIMFEVFKVPAIALYSQEALAVRGSGRSTGLAVDIGATLCSVVPVYEGHALSHVVGWDYSFGGREVTDLLRKLCAERGYQFTTSADMRAVEEMKKELCYVALDPASDPGTERDFYPHPDAPPLTIGSERWRAAEALFSSRLIGSDGNGIHSLIHQGINKCDKDLRNDMYQNIVLSGGSSLLPGLTERLQKELASECLAGDSAPVRVIAPEHGHGAWAGGSVTASVGSFEKTCITVAEYEEDE